VGLQLSFYEPQGYLGVVCLLHASAALLLLNMRSGGPRADLAWLGEEKRLFTLPVTGPRFLSCPVPNLTPKRLP